MKTLLIFMGLLATCIFINAQIQTKNITKSKYQRKAFVVGIEDYIKKNNFDKLNYTIDDAKAIGSTLEGLNFKITYSIDEDNLKLKENLVKWYNTIKENDTIIFYFSGHGTQQKSKSLNKSDNFLIPAKNRMYCSYNDYNEGAISLNEVINNVFEKNTKGIKIFITDACRVQAEYCDTLQSKSNLDNKIIYTIPNENSDIVENYAIFFATSRESISYDGYKNQGLFSYFFNQELKKTNLSLANIFANTKKNVENESANYKDGPQIPKIIANNILGDLFLRKTNNSNPVPLPSQNEIRKQVVDYTIDKGKYTGLLINNLPNDANGKIIWEDSSYEGSFVNGNVEGYGVYRTSEELYKGFWKNNQRDGEAEVVYYDKEGKIFKTYNGKFSNNLANDVDATLKVIDSYIYRGNYKDGKINGKGKITYQNGNSYDGDWLNGNMVGSGIYIFSNGNKYNGKFKNNLKEGFFKVNFSSGDYYEGDYSNDDRNGVGTYYMGAGRVLNFCPNGVKYIGYWKNNLKHGKGKVYDIGGNLIFDGEFADDKPLGNYPNKEIYSTLNLNEKLDFNQIQKLKISNPLVYEDDFKNWKPFEGIDIHDGILDFYDQTYLLLNKDYNTNNIDFMININFKSIYKTCEYLTDDLLHSHQFVVNSTTDFPIKGIYISFPVEQDEKFKSLYKKKISIGFKSGNAYYEKIKISDIDNFSYCYSENESFHNFKIYSLGSFYYFIIDNNLIGTLSKTEIPIDEGIKTLFFQNGVTFTKNASSSKFKIDSFSIYQIKQ